MTTLADLASTHGLVECPECDGRWQSFPFPVRQICPNCVKGWTPDPEIVEEVAGAEAKAAGFISPLDEGHDVARAGLLAYLAWIEERL